MQTRILYEDGAQTIRHVPMSIRGLPTRVTSATYAIVDLRNSEDASDRTVASGSATLGSESATIGAAAGPSTANDRRIQVNAVTSFQAGYKYIVEKSDGLRELIELDRVDDGSTKYLWATHGLRHTYASGDTVKAVELTCSFPSAEASSETSLKDGGGPYQVTFDYDIEGRQYLVPSVLWLSRYSAQPFIDDTDVVRLDPTIVYRSRDRLPMNSAIMAAHQDYMTACDLADTDPVYFRVTLAAKLAVANRAIEYLYRWQQGSESDERAADRAEDRYEKLVKSRLRGQPDRATVEVDHNEDTAKTVKRYGQDLFRVS